MIYIPARVTVGISITAVSVTTTTPAAAAAVSSTAAVRHCHLDEVGGADLLKGVGFAVKQRECVEGESSRVLREGTLHLQSRERDEGDGR
jgi:hypothetical protein